MTIRMALKHIRRNTPETEKTFQTIRQNRNAPMQAICCFLHKSLGAAAGLSDCR